MWNDNWAANNNEEGLDTICPAGMENLKVSELINIGTMEWNKEEVKSLFSIHDFNVITNIPLSSRIPDDKIIWAHTKNGQYTIRSGYWVGMHK